MAWATLLEVKAHLRLSDWGESPGPEDTDLQLKLDQAEDIVQTYIERPDDADWADEIASWDDTSVPPGIKAAVLCMVGHLYRFRGDDAAADAPKAEHGFLPPQVVNLLHRWRDPAVA